MKKIATMAFMAVALFFGASTAQAGNETDTLYIKVNAQQEPVNYVNSTVEELKAAVGELETILETDDFQLYQCGDYSFKVQDGIVVTQSIQIEDANDTKVTYNKILNALQKTKFIKDTHNTGGNNFQYSNFQVQFDDFQGYSKLTYSVLPENNLTEY
ncbi:MAG: hypothetical protein IJP74_05855 [Prevotella sp.]|nr:hypothetical protein [Prevotella sp.]